MSARAPIMVAEIVAVGSELLVPPRLDTNSLTITAGLSELGITVRAKVVVGDRVDDVARLVRSALDHADLVVLTGGLGPTDDDVTREAVAAVLGRPMHEAPEILARLEARFASRGLTMPAINRRQALVIEGAVVLDNANGTAPGQWIEAGDRVVVLLPGPPRELKPIFAALVDGPLAARAASTRVLTRGIIVAGLSESHAEERLQPLYEAWRQVVPPIDATILASAGQIELHLFARGERAAADRVLDRAVLDVQGVLGAHIVSTDGRSIEEVVGGMLEARGWHIALAESCTGGLVTSRLTDVPGSSAWVDRSVVVYSNAAKVALLGVPETTLATHGAVSEAVAVAMAEGVRRLAGVEVGVGVTGIAGPGGGSGAKPVGTVCMAVVAGDTIVARTFRYPGARTYVKTFASLGAIDLVRRTLGAHGGDVEAGTWARPATGG